MAVLKNLYKPAPKWFVKLKKAMSFLTDGAIVILLGIGYAEDSLVLLILRIGVSAVLNTIEVFLSDEEIEISNT